MNAFDTNILVYAHRKDSPFHGRALALVKEHAEGIAPWAIPWPCVHEFISVVTHPRVYREPTSPAQAQAQVEAWLSSPSLVLLAESDGYWPVLSDLLTAGRIQGPKVHDARVAALALFHRVKVLYSADRDFSRFTQLAVKNPLV